MFTSLSPLLGTNASQETQTQQCHLVNQTPRIQARSVKGQQSIKNVSTKADVQQNVLGSPGKAVCMEKATALQALNYYLNY